MTEPHRRWRVGCTIGRSVYIQRFDDYQHEDDEDDA